MGINLEHFQNLTEKIDAIVASSNTDYIDAIVSYCSTHNLEIETIGELISKLPGLKSKVENDAGALHCLKA
jgi:hypothetical protein